MLVLKYSINFDSIQCLVHGQMIPGIFFFIFHPSEVHNELAKFFSQLLCVVTVMSYIIFFFLHTFIFN